MGHVGNKFVLVFLHFVELHGHVVQSVGQISHLVLGVKADAVGQVACRVLRGRVSDLFQRNVHGFRKKQQDNQGQPEQDGRRDIHNI